MKEFKFLSKNTTGYDGEMSREAIMFIHNLHQGGTYRNMYAITTEIAEYRLGQTVYVGGEIIRAVITAYPHSDSTIKITFWINVGTVFPYITQHRIDFDYQIEYNIGHEAI